MLFPRQRHRGTSIAPGYIDSLVPHRSNGRRPQVRGTGLLPLEHVRECDDPQINARQRPQIACLACEARHCTTKNAAGTRQETVKGMPESASMSRSALQGWRSFQSYVGLKTQQPPLPTEVDTTGSAFMRLSKGRARTLTHQISRRGCDQNQLGSLGFERQYCCNCFALQQQR